MLLIRIIFVVTFAVSTRSQAADDLVNPEQSRFGTEEVPGEPLVTRPVPLPNSVLQLLSEDVDVKGCLSFNPLPAGKSLAFLFIGSTIHLNGKNASDLVVVPVPDYGCFHSAAGIGTFWVFGRAGEKYKLLLKTLGNGLTVLKAKYKGYRIIQTATIGQAGQQLTTISYRFNGEQYQKYRGGTQEAR